MKKLLPQGILHLFPVQDGFIFVAQEGEVDEKSIVAYKKCDLVKGVVEPITRGTYLISKFGNSYEHFEDNPEDYVTCKTVSISDDRLFVLHTDGRAEIYDINGVPAWDGKLLYKGTPAQNVIAGPHSLWASFSAAGAIKKYSLRTMHEELRIGGNNDTFQEPDGMWIESDFLLVCCAKAQKIIRVDLNTYTLEDYETFPEPVRQYIKVLSYEIVLLDSGVYLI